MLVRPLLVVLPPEVIEGPLLGDQRRARGPNRLGLQGLVHSLMGAVLLRVARANALVLNAQSHPPHVELREPMNARSSRRARRCPCGWRAGDRARERDDRRPGGRRGLSSTAGRDTPSRIACADRRSSAGSSRRRRRSETGPLKSAVQRSFGCCRQRRAPRPGCRCGRRRRRFFTSPCAPADPQRC